MSEGTTSKESVSKTDDQSPVDKGQQTEDKSSKSPLGNQFGVRQRSAIVEEYNKQTESKLDGTDLFNSDTSSENEESNTGKDLKQPKPGPESQKLDNSSESDIPKSSKKDGREDKKTVPLEALHQAREQKRQVTLEYREFKQDSQKKIDALMAEVDKLKNLVTTKQQSKENDYENNDTLDTHELTDAAQKKIAELEARLEKYEGDKETRIQQQELEKQKKAQEETQKKILTAHEELAQEGYRGFKFAVLEVDKAMMNKYHQGDLTEAELTNPEVWKQTFKDEVFPTIAAEFNEGYNKELMSKKKELKKKAGLVSNPGQAPEQPTPEDEDPKTYDEFLSKGMNDVQKQRGARFRTKRPPTR